MIVYIEQVDRILEKRHKNIQKEKQATEGQNENDNELDMISGGIDEILEKDKEFFWNIQEH